MQFRIFHNKFKGFTFIEMAIVIAIIGIIASLTLTGLNSVRANSRDTKRVSDISQIQTALELYKRENYTYPSVLTPGVPLVVGTQTYLDAVPTSPGTITGDTYTYVQDNNGLSYHINYVLERPLAGNIGGTAVGSTGSFYKAVPGQPNLSVVGCLPSCSSQCAGASDGCGGTCTVACSWKTLGTAGFSGVINDSVVLAFNPSTNQPYVAYANSANDPNKKVTVMYYNGSTWVTLGSSGFSAGNAYYIDLAFNPSTNQPYVVYKDGANSNKATVMYYDGATWTTLGTAGFSADVVDDTTIAFNPSTNQPYVAYRDAANSYKATVMYYNGATWANYGSAGFTPARADIPTMAFNPSTNQPFVAFMDYNVSRKASVMYYNGSAWANYGSAGISAGYIDYLSMAFNPNTSSPYVAYQDGGNPYGTTVKLYTGVAWETPGIAKFSTYAHFNSIAFNPSTNQPYVVFKDVQGSDPNSSSSKATVMYYNGSSWVALGSTLFSAGRADYTTIAFNPSTNQPYVAYNDIANGQKVTVMYWAP